MKNGAIKQIHREQIPYPSANEFQSALVLREADGADQDIVERTFDFAVEIVRLCQKLDEKGGVSKIIMSQILRAGTSVGANLEEAQAAQSRADFLSKVSIALKEARETYFRLRVLNKSNVASLAELPALTDEAYEIRQVLGAIAASTKGTRRAS